MTEIEKIAYAKSFIDQLAIGVNPIDGTRIPDGEVATNPRLSKCFFYVSDLLSRMINEKTQNSKPSKKVNLNSSTEHFEKIRYSEVATTTETLRQGLEDVKKVQVNTTVSSDIVKPIEKNATETESEKKSCLNCRFQASGECSSWDPCDDFQPVYRISQSEMSYWPKEGDATRFKRKGYKK